MRQSFLHATYRSPRQDHPERAAGLCRALPPVYRGVPVRTAFDNVFLTTRYPTTECTPRPLLALEFLASRFDAFWVSQCPPDFGTRIPVSAVDSQLREAGSWQDTIEDIVDLVSFASCLPGYDHLCLPGGQFSVHLLVQWCDWLEIAGPPFSLISWKCQNPRYPSQPSCHPRHARPRSARLRRTPP